MSEKLPRVFLGNPPWRKKGRLGVRAGSRWPFTMEATAEERVPGYLPFPFFLAYTAAVLEAADIPVLLIDAIATGIDDDEFIRRIVEFAPALVVLETSTPTFKTDMQLAKLIKARQPGVKLALSGAHPSFVREAALRDHPWIDFVAVGEYEYTVRELSLQLEAPETYGGIQGLIYRQRGIIAANPRRPVVSNLDELPRPAYHHLPMYNYNDDFQVLAQPNVQMWTSRGCPYKCIFCMWPQVMYGNHLYRVRAPEQVVGEMEWLLETYGFKGVYFDDDTFNLGKRRMLAICSLIKERRLQTPWAVMARADTIDEETLAAMASAGLAGIKYGIESASQAIVDGSGKELNLEKALQAIRFTQKYGVKVHLTFTFGLPGETSDTIRQTIEFALQQKTHSVQFSITTPFPGTRYFEMLKAKDLIITEDWDDYDGNLSAVMRTENLSALELKEALDEAVKRYWKERQAWV